jgi:hypothetical protein
LACTALKFAQARLSPGMVEQIAGEAAVDTPDSYFEAVNKEYTQQAVIPWWPPLIKWMAFTALPRAARFTLLPGCLLIMPISFASGCLKALATKTKP